MDERLKAFESLLNIMDKLRNKCPWDKQQTLESLRYLTIEETYELSDAIIEGDLQEVGNELGDLLLHIVFYAKIGEEKGAFTILDVIERINKKLIERHPHIFGDVEAKDAESVKNNWEKIKLAHGKVSVLEGVPKSLPAIVKAYRIQEKVRGVGFDWEKPEQVWEKVKEELNELKEEVDNHSSLEKIEHEMGDLLFALVNYARFIDVNPEDALERTNKRFIKRFKYLEESALRNDKKLQNMTLDEMDVFWEEAKKRE
ncbi:MAG: nucleoside triphosphate pyrophosphohydrolase [Bacteroidales bacterium]|nr:nucleoside triphosphate pyrophosphohydrolase [Bacteroidales bacterium]